MVQRCTAIMKRKGQESLNGKDGQEKGGGGGGEHKSSSDCEDVWEFKGGGERGGGQHSERSFCYFTGIGWR
eukprot:749094-Hanusia_phi.AAC.1